MSYHTNHKGGERPVIMTAITEEEEKLIDEDKTITIKRGNTKFTVSKKNIYGYGHIDFSNNSDDREDVDNFNFLDNLDSSGYPIDSIDYDKGVFTGRWYATWHPFVVCQLMHAYLGKPERVCIFRKVLNYE